MDFLLSKKYFVLAGVVIILFIGKVLLSPYMSSEDEAIFIGGSVLSVFWLLISLVSKEQQLHPVHSVGYKELAEKYNLVYNPDASGASDFKTEMDYIENKWKSCDKQVTSYLVTGVINGIKIELLGLNVWSRVPEYSESGFLVSRESVLEATTRISVDGATKYIYQSSNGLSGLYGTGSAQVSVIEKIFQEIQSKRFSSLFNDSYGYVPLSKTGFLPKDCVYFYEGTHDRPSLRMTFKSKPTSGEKRVGLIVVIVLVIAFVAMVLFSADFSPLNINTLLS
jgi:hypothetical protein